MDKDIDMSTLTIGSTTTDVNYIDSIDLGNGMRTVPSVITTTDGTGSWITTTNTDYTVGLPEEPKQIGAPGELFTDDNGYQWVMSLKGWRHIAQQWIVEDANEPKRGTKKKLKCF